MRVNRGLLGSCCSLELACFGDDLVLFVLAGFEELADLRPVLEPPLAPVLVVRLFGDVELFILGIKKTRALRIDLRLLCSFASQ